MTRAKEITKEAKKFAKEIDDWEIAEDVQDAFEQGAEWADAHNEGLNMHIKYLKEELIDKACEWLYDHLYTRRDEQSPTNHFVCSKQEMLTQTEFVEQFHKAMEGGSSEKPNNPKKGGEK